MERESFQAFLVAVLDSACKEPMPGRMFPWRSQALYLYGPHTLLRAQPVWSHHVSHDPLHPPPSRCSPNVFIHLNRHTPPRAPPARLRVPKAGSGAPEARVGCPSSGPLCRDRQKRLVQSTLRAGRTQSCSPEDYHNNGGPPFEKRSRSTEQSKRF